MFLQIQLFFYLILVFSCLQLCTKRHLITKLPSPQLQPKAKTKQNPWRPSQTNKVCCHQHCCFKCLCLLPRMNLLWRHGDTFESGNWFTTAIGPFGCISSVQLCFVLSIIETQLCKLMFCELYVVCMSHCELCLFGPFTLHLRQ